jgi:hypothetical protein
MRDARMMSGEGGGFGGPRRGTGNSDDLGDVIAELGLEGM